LFLVVPADQAGVRKLFTLPRFGVLWPAWRYPVEVAAKDGWLQPLFAFTSSRRPSRAPVRAAALIPCAATKPTNRSTSPNRAARTDCAAMPVAP